MSDNNIIAVSVLPLIKFNSNGLSFLHMLIFQDPTSSAQESMEYITSSHKKLFLRFITSHSNFFNGLLNNYSGNYILGTNWLDLLILDPEQFAEYLKILTNDLNSLGIVRTQVEWLKTLQTWAAVVEIETTEYDNG